MNRKDLLATLVDILSKEEAPKPRPRASFKQQREKRPPSNRGRAMGLLGLTATVPRKVYKIVIEHCDGRDITVAHYLRELIDNNLGTNMTGNMPRVSPKTSRTTTPMRRPDGQQRASRGPVIDTPDSEPDLESIATAKHHARGTQKRVQRGGRKAEFTDDDVREYIEVFHKENPAVSAHEIFNHLRKEYGLKFSHNRGMRLLRSVKSAQSLNGKSENNG